MSTLFLLVLMTGFGKMAGQEIEWHTTVESACESLSKIGDIRFKQVYSVSTWIDPEVEQPVSDIWEVDCQKEKITRRVEM